MNGALWVEISGDNIIARLRGEPTAVKWLTETPLPARLTSVK